MKLRIGLMCILLSAALYFSSEAVRSLKHAADSSLPCEVYSQYESQKNAARYFLKSRGGYITVFGESGCRKPLETTGIETGILRRADRAMLEKGIPVRDRTQLLELLEDLGS